MTAALSDVERILWEEWDPIEVNGFPEAFGEYDAYALHIYGLLQAPTRPSVHEIAAYLGKARTRWMALNANPDHDHEIATKLLGV